MLQYLLLPPSWLPQQNVQQLGFLQRRWSSGRYRYRRGPLQLRSVGWKVASQRKPPLDYIRAHHIGEYAQSAGEDDVSATDVDVRWIDGGETEGWGSACEHSGSSVFLGMIPDPCLFGHRRLTLVESTIRGQLWVRHYYYYSYQASLFPPSLDQSSSFDGCERRPGLLSSQKVESLDGVLHRNRVNFGEMNHGKNGFYWLTFDFNNSAKDAGLWHRRSALLSCLSGAHVNAVLKNQVNFRIIWERYYTTRLKRASICGQVRGLMQWRCAARTTSLNWAKWWYKGIHNGSVRPTVV